MLGIPSSAAFERPRHRSRIRDVVAEVAALVDPRHHQIRLAAQDCVIAMFTQSVGVPSTVKTPAPSLLQPQRTRQRQRMADRARLRRPARRSSPRRAAEAPPPAHESPATARHRRWSRECLAYEPSSIARAPGRHDWLGVQGPIGSGPWPRLRSRNPYRLLVGPPKIRVARLRAAGAVRRRPDHLFRRPAGSPRDPAVPPERAARTTGAAGEGRRGRAPLRAVRRRVAADRSHGAPGGGARRGARSPQSATADLYRHAQLAAAARPTPCARCTATA